MTNLKPFHEITHEHATIAYAMFNRVPLISTDPPQVEGVTILREYLEDGENGDVFTVRGVGTHTGQPVGELLYVGRFNSDYLSLAGVRCVVHLTLEGYDLGYVSEVTHDKH